MNKGTCRLNSCDDSVRFFGSLLCEVHYDKMKLSGLQTLAFIEQMNNLDTENYTPVNATYESNIEEALDEPGERKFHTLKIQEQFAFEKQDGLKPFEIRVNDRNYKIGDLVMYKVVGDQGTQVYRTNNAATEVEANVYEITSIHNYRQKTGNIVFGERKIGEVKLYD